MNQNFFFIILSTSILITFYCSIRAFFINKKLYTLLTILEEEFKQEEAILANKYDSGEIETDEEFYSKIMWLSQLYIFILEDAKNNFMNNKTKGRVKAK